MPDFLCYCVLAPAALAFCIDVVWERHFAPFPHHINTGIAWLRLAAARKCLRALATIQVLRGGAARLPASA
jgi:lipoprotein signal peptidase